ncbi:MAG: hypothetical protein AAB556_00490 [Patescibacteria group bacterium]
MKVVLSESFENSFEKLPPEIVKKFRKQLIFLLSNIRHPSLRAKKYGGENDLWQARVDDDFRFYFKIKKGSYIIMEITKHPK